MHKDVPIEEIEIDISQFDEEEDVEFEEELEEEGEVEEEVIDHEKDEL